MFLRCFFYKFVVFRYIDLKIWSRKHRTSKEKHRYFENIDKSCVSLRCIEKTNSIIDHQLHTLFRVVYFEILIADGWWLANDGSISGWNAVDHVYD